LTKYAIVDSANLFYRARHVVQGDAYTKGGMALHIVFRSLRKMMRDHNCDHVVLCLEGKSWRFDVYPDYKGKRRAERAVAALNPSEREEEEVFLHIMDEFAAFMSEKTRVTVLQSPGVEGDDFVARWVQLHPNDEHVILSGDSDFVQLLAPNVSIYNGVDEVLLTSKGLFNSFGDPLVFNVDVGKGKIKVLGTPAEAKKKHDEAEKKKAKLKPSYEIQPWSWTMEEEWWRKALFIKIIRGDTSDTIPSAFPGVRYEGSAKKGGIREAWENRNTQDYHWNNFMLQKWDRTISIDEDGNKKIEQVRVLDAFNFNEMLIDLTQQPQNVKDLMDSVIVQAVQKEPVGNVGIAFMKFCGANGLPNLAKEASDHAQYLNKGYA
jgi:5'-3' exonuclease